MAANLLREIKMGKVFSFARSDAWENTSYILNLTTNVVGKKRLEAYKERELSARELHADLREHVGIAVAKMSTTVIAEIAVYGGWHGLHYGPACSADFLNMTGWNDVTDPLVDLTYRDSREMIEELAILTIACVAYDIIRQERVAGELRP